jgi:hypothetical protein
VSIVVAPHSSGKKPATYGSCSGCAGCGCDMIHKCFPKERTKDER